MPLCLTVCLRIKHFQNKNTAQIELLIDIGNRIASYDFDVLTYTNYSAIKHIKLKEIIIE